MLTGSLGAAAAAAVPGWTAGQDPARRPLVDTHTHFYDPTRPEGVPWPGKDTPLYRRVLPPDWLAVAARRYHADGRRRGEPVGGRQPVAARRGP